MVETLLTDSPLLGVVLPATVGVHHPAHVWAQLRAGRVQEGLHHRWGAAVDSYGEQLGGPAGDPHSLCERAAIGNACLVLKVVSDHNRSQAVTRVSKNWCYTRQKLFLSGGTLTEKDSQALESGNSLSSSTTASASLILGIVSKARRSAPAANKPSTCGRCQSFSSCTP